MAPTEPLRYKLELDFVFAFNEALLSVPGSAKKIPYKIRNRPPFNKLEDSTAYRVYNSWGVYDEDEPTYRPYVKEPAKIARGILEAEGVPMDPVVEVYGPQNQTVVRFAPWHITAQKLLPGVGPAGLCARLPQHVTKTNVGDWDCYGLRAFSQLLADSNEEGNQDELASLTKYISGLRSDGSRAPNHAAFLTNLGGLHVCVEAPKDLEVLKELAFIIFIYEDELNRTHPPFRRLGHPSTNGILTSNRLELMHRVQVELNKSPGNTHHIDMSRPDVIRRYFLTSQIRKAIEECENEIDLASMIGGGSTGVVSWRWTSLIENAPLFLAFRQHCGSLDPREINPWIAFVQNIVRLARQYAEMGSHPVATWQDVTVFTLMNGLSNAHYQYFDARIALFQGYQEDGPHNATDIEIPPDESVGRDSRVRGDEIPSSGTDDGSDERPGEGLVDGPDRVFDDGPDDEPDEKTKTLVDHTKSTGGEYVPSNMTESGGDETEEGGDETEEGGDETKEGGDETEEGGDGTDEGGDETDEGGDETEEDSDESEEGSDEGTETGTKRLATEDPSEDPHIGKKQKGRPKVGPKTTKPTKSVKQDDRLPDADPSRQRGVLYEGGTVADEDMIYLNQKLYVRNYNASDWDIIYTPDNGQYNETSLPHKCGIWALFNSLQYQYPKDATVIGLEYGQVREAVEKESANINERDIRLGSHGIFHRTYSPMELARGLQTLGRYKLVTCSEEGHQLATRIASPEEVLDYGQNVYLLDGSAKTGSKHLHWSAMCRRGLGPKFNGPDKLAHTPIESEHPASSHARNPGAATVIDKPAGSTPSKPSASTPSDMPLPAPHQSGWTPINAPGSGFKLSGFTRKHPEAGKTVLFAPTSRPQISSQTERLHTVKKSLLSFTAPSIIQRE